MDSMTTKEIKFVDGKSKRIFASPLLERISRTHVAIPVIIFLLYATGIMYWSIRYIEISPGLTMLFSLFGLAVFTWVEYNVHRYVFHIATSTKRKKRFQYIVHGVHHEYPKDKERLAMPPLLSITVATFFFIVFRYILGDYAFAFMPGFLVGYASYLLIHYMVHAVPPPKGWLRTLWKNHAIHHYKDGEVLFGVSSPLWDYIYGTTHDSRVSN
ncbi:fatty acid hydroxylase [Chryseotalea sanaruensis]|uniref:Fatty acid hydroxylase n=1 Tax=Chryseotalea sanaruensis TaxID=2482724 RepID=A0A401U685_9BACT|nr:sterol desaturase family protein [Chryseotalea sanaruensis]GCC50389.1 fatty acid hydroxylase [Chryseotalea sanaruensis]